MSSFFNAVLFDGKIVNSDFQNYHGNVMKEKRHDVLQLHDKARGRLIKATDRYHVSDQKKKVRG